MGSTTLDSILFTVFDILIELLRIVSWEYSIPLSWRRPYFVRIAAIVVRAFDGSASLTVRGRYIRRNSARACQRATRRRQYADATFWLGARKVEPARLIVGYRNSDLRNTLSQDFKPLDGQSAMISTSLPLSLAAPKMRARSQYRIPKQPKSTLCVFAL